MDANQRSPSRPSTHPDLDHLLEHGFPEDPLEEARVLAQVQQGLFPETRPLEFGRFVILEALGAGGGGAVYAAYDPKLERKVALKLLWAEAGGGDIARARLLREAQALARVSHPNVLAVHDVGALGGEFPLPDALVDPRLPRRDVVYMVTEYVTGPTLSQWLDGPPRAWRQIVRVLMAAGRGLAAAHRQGLVHRDFKPSNVLIGDDGRVIVLDFGLARSYSSSSEEVVDTGESRPSHALLHETLTQAGGAAGTPCYMAPEQHQRKPADARSDQFAFCVTLFEALYGELPYRGDTEELARAKLDGCSNFPPDRPRERPRVPGSIRRALRRGLEPDPAQRHASIDALLFELQRAHDRLRRGTSIALACLAVFAVMMGVGLAQTRERAQSPCDAGHDRFASVWDDAAKARMAGAFERTDTPFGPGVWRSVVRRLDPYVAQWQQLHQEICRSGLIDGRQPMSVTTDKLDCLERRRLRLAGLVALFEAADARVVENAVEASHSLPSLAACRLPAQTGADEGARSPWVDAAAKLRMELMLAEGDAHLYAARIDAAQAIALEVAAQAEALARQDILARSWLFVGKVRRARMLPSEAEVAYREAWLAAERSSDRETALEALVELVAVVGSLLARVDEGLELARVCRARLEAVGALPHLELALHINTARVHERGGDYKNALVALERALQIARASYPPDHTVLADIYNLQGVNYDRLARNEQSLELYERALAIRRRALGEAHPKVANALGNTAVMLNRQGDREQARARITQAIAIYRAVAAQHPSIALNLRNLGHVLVGLGRPDEALERHLEAAELYRVTRGPRHPDHAGALASVAYTLNHLGRHEEALEMARQSIAVFGEDARHPHLGYGLRNAAAALRRLGRAGEALVLLERALSIWRERMAGHPHSARMLLDYASTLDVLGRRDEARDAAHEAMAIRMDHERGRDPLRLAEYRLVLAELDADVDARRALEQAEQAYLSLRSSSVPGHRAMAARASDLVSTLYVHVADPMQGQDRPASEWTRVSTRAVATASSQPGH